MFKLRFLLCFLLISFVTQAQFELQELTPNIHIFTSYNTYQGNKISANGMICLTAEGAVVIDTPWDEAEYQTLIDTIQNKWGKELKMVIATHSHADRAGGFGFYNSKGIETISSKRTDEILQAEQKARASSVFQKDTTINLGGQKIEVIFPGEGHTKDNVIVYFAKEKVFFGGCFLKSEGSTDMGYIGEANLANWPTAIEITQKQFKKAKYVVPGHGEGLSHQAFSKTLELLEGN
jgi:metallo-beta-lactamase class B